MKIEIYKDAGLVDLSDGVSEPMTIDMAEFWQICLAGLYMASQENIGGYVRLHLGSYKGCPMVLDELVKKMNKQASWENCAAVFKEAMEGKVFEPNVLVAHGKRFQLTNEIPEGYQFWNIGKNFLPKGYVPLCQLMPGSEYDVNSNTLKAIQVEDSHLVMWAASHFRTVEEMEEFVEENKGKELDVLGLRKMEVAEAGLRALKPFLERNSSPSLDERLDCAVKAAGDERTRFMRDYLKKHDPYFATDEYLDSLSKEELKEYFEGCLQVVRESYRDAGDDWAQRRESLAAENLGFHG